MCYCTRGKLYMRGVALSRTYYYREGPVVKVVEQRDLQMMRPLYYNISLTDADANGRQADILGSELITPSHPPFYPSNISPH